MTQQELQALEARRTELCLKAQALHTKVQNNTWTATDQAESDRITAEYDDVSAKITAGRATQNRLAQIVADGEKLDTPISASITTAAGGTHRGNFRPMNCPTTWTTRHGQQRQSFSINEDERRFYALPKTAAINEAANSPEGIEAFCQFLRRPKSFTGAAGGDNFFRTIENIAGQKTLNIFRQDSDTRGGQFVLPEFLMSGILKNLDDAVHTLGMSRSITVESSDTMSIMTRTHKASYVGPRSELGNRLKTIEDSLAYGKRSMQTHEFGMVALMSERLLENATIDIWSLYQQEITLAGSEWMEQKLLYGTGIREPLGLFVNDSVNGIGSDRDITVLSGELGANAPGHWHIYDHFGYETLLRMFFALKPGHQNNSNWMFNTNQMLNLCLITDPNGQYIWKPSPINGVGNTLLGRPVVHNYWAPNAQEPDAYFGILGNFDYNWVLWHRQMRMRTLTELLALQGIVVVFLDFNFDAQPVLPEAFVRGKYDPD
jgi:HK97 family phage major capsid protein